MKDQKNGLNIPRKSRVLLVAVLVLMVAITAGGTLAWLMDSSDSIKNNFIVPEVKPSIQESFVHGTTKSNVYVLNDVSLETGIDVYIRVALVPTWETADGEHVAPMPASLDDLIIDWNVANDGVGEWKKIGDYYYYTAKVAPGGKTSNLIDSAMVNPNREGAKAGYRMNLQVLAEAIQATESAVNEAWTSTVWNSLKH